MEEMNAFETQEFERQKKLSDIADHVATLLHPLVSPYDQSGSNLRAQMYNNPFFRRAVDHLSHVIFERIDITKL